MSDTRNIIAFAGLPGAYSDLACREVYPGLSTLACRSFADAFEAVREGAARLAMIPVENSAFGRVADIHHLLPEGGLHIIAEHFQPIRHCLLGQPGATVERLKRVRSHPQALGQCRHRLRAMGLEPVADSDTAGAASRMQGPEEAALASELAAEIYNLEILQRDMQDEGHNTTRFLVLSCDALTPPFDPRPEAPPVLTSFIFRVRNIPAALYKAMGGFATNGINMTRLESYIAGGSFNAAQFFCDVEGHPQSDAMRHAFEELGFYADEVRILGTYPRHRFRDASSAD